MRQRGIEAKIARFHLRCRRPEQAMGFPRRIDSRGVVSSEESGLQLSSPIEEFGESQHRITRETMFGVRFVIVVGIEASESRTSGREVSV